MPSPAAADRSASGTHTCVTAAATRKNPAETIIISAFAVAIHGRASRRAVPAR